MDRTFKSSDLFTVLGMMMTLVGIFICLLFLFTPIVFGETLSDMVVNTSPDFQLSMRWIQPIVGQAIVEDALIKQQYGNEVGEATKTRNWIQSQATEGADAMKIDRAALVQWVIGRLIVELTSHRIESGRLGDSTNQRIMTIAQQVERQFNETLSVEWQTKLGRKMGVEPVRRT